MKSTFKLLGLAALALVFSVSAPVASNTALADDDQPGVAESGVVEIDFALFDVAEGEKVEYYRERLNAISKMLSEAPRPDDATIKRVNETLPKAYLTIFKNLSRDESVPAEEREQYYSIYVRLLTQVGDLADIEALIAEEKAKETPDKDRIESLEAARLARAVQTAVEKKDSAELKNLMTEFVEAAKTNDSLARDAEDVLEAIGGVDSDLAAATFDKVVETFSAMKDDELRQRLADMLPGKKRMATLVGNDMFFEGVDMEGNPVDWESYRGKVVLIDIFATWCGPCMGEVPGIKANYEKYHDAGFEVISYSVDQDLDDLKEYEEKEKHPWTTVSEVMSTEVKNEDGTQKYKSVSDYYGVNAIPRMILVGKDGKAIDVNARGAHLTELLEGLFPEVK